jgi:hypothetical protein
VAANKLPHSRMRKHFAVARTALRPKERHTRRGVPLGSEYSTQV